jgi:hypothetical protein
MAAPDCFSHSDLSFSCRETTTSRQSATSLKTNSDIKFVPRVQNSTPHSLLSLSKIPTVEKPWILLGQASLFIPSETAETKLPMMCKQQAVTYDGNKCT